MSRKRAFQLLALIALIAIGLVSVAALGRSHARVIRATRAFFLGGRLLSDRSIVLQTGPRDCGPTALQHVMRIQGMKRTPAMAVGMSGWTPQEIVAAARRAGIPAIDSDIPLQRLSNLGLPSIALMGTHYVVIEQRDANGYIVFDPDIGRMRVGEPYFARDWTGHVVLFSNTRVPLAPAKAPERHRYPARAVLYGPKNSKNRKGVSYA
jgi:ABC-type bacteriocin/lantibiotic exporter with double-glycine peptidase domain